MRLLLQCYHYVWTWSGRCARPTNGDKCYPSVTLSAALNLSRGYLRCSWKALNQRPWNVWDVIELLLDIPWDLFEGQLWAVLCTGVL